MAMRNCIEHCIQESILQEMNRSGIFALPSIRETNTIFSRKYPQYHLTSLQIYKKISQNNITNSNMMNKRKYGR